MSRVLVPIDGSEASHRAVRFAARVAPALGARLDIVHVLDLSLRNVYDGFYLASERLALIEEEVEEMLRTARALLPDGVEATTRSIKGSVLEMLLLESGNADVELVVLGRTGKGAITRLIEGSVSRGLAFHADAPVSLVP